MTVKYVCDMNRPFELSSYYKLGHYCEHD